jgi:hypothetical protein
MVSEVPIVNGITPIFTVQMRCIPIKLVQKNIKNRRGFFSENTYNT